MGINYEARPFKGRSLLEFPKNYTVIDVETTGLDPYWNEIIEAAALRVRDGKVVDSFASLVKPKCGIDSFIEELTGITNEMVAAAPPIEDVLPEYLDFIGADIIVGHNVHFDVNFVYDAGMSYCNRPCKNDVVDTMRLSRWILPHLIGHTLSDVSEALDICQEGEHRSLVDCQTTFAVMEALRATGFDFASVATDKARGRYHLKAADITAKEGLQQPDNPLFGKVCVFTGALSISRKEAMQAVVDIGGICSDSVTQKTNFLILGNNDYCSSIKDGKSSKQKKAESLMLKGQDLQILSESAFFDMLGSI